MKIFQPNITGSVAISGSLNVTQGITGSLFGTASYALNGGGGNSGPQNIEVIDYISSSQYFSLTTNIPAASGTINLVSGSISITGSGTNFYNTNEDGLGYWYELWVNDQTLNKWWFILINTIEDNTHATISSVQDIDNIITNGFYNTQYTQFPGTTEAYNWYIGKNISNGYRSFVHGISNIANVFSSHAEGYQTRALGNTSHAEGNQTIASGSDSHAEGASTQAKGDGSHAEGIESIASGSYSHAEGRQTITIGSYSHAEGWLSIASGSHSHAEGVGGKSYGAYSHAEGNGSYAIGNASHAEGSITQAIGNASHTEGDQTIAIGSYSHAEGSYTTSSGDYSHAEGSSSISIGTGSHAEGYYTIANGNYQHVQGQFNQTLSAQAAFILGNGTDNANRSNLIFASGNTVQITGSLILSGSITTELDVKGDTIITGSLIVSGSGGSGVFSKGGTIADLTNGISTSGSYIVWRAPFSCSVISLYGRRSEGGNAQINARRSGSGGYSLHTGSNLILGTNNTWLQSLNVTNVLYAPGDSLEIVISGSANNQVAVQVDYIKI